jgi:hypothetical protein
MMNGSSPRRLFTLFCLSLPLLTAANGHAVDQRGRRPSPADGDPCGLPDTTTAAYRLAAAQNWGYGYDLLCADLARWSDNPSVRVDSVGASVLNRAIYMLTLEDNSTPAQPRKRVWIHARTHPNEVQGTWVTNRIIEQLLDSSAFSRQVRRECVFNIIPMINPDGVELQYARENAHKIDIESNWTANPGEPEVQTLRRMFFSLMAQPNPIRIALNMHSAYGTSRYFVYHAAAGTSDAYAVAQQRFIQGVRNYFPGGIQPYTHFVSWTTAPSLVYPESWFWQNHRENVLALTYEDMNSTAARAFDSTANAILRGIADELGVSITTVESSTHTAPTACALEQNYPNPFNPSTKIRFSIPAGSAGRSEAANRMVRLAVYDLLGREVATLVQGPLAGGVFEVSFDGTHLASGVYLLRLHSGDFVRSRKMNLIK